MSKNLNLCQFIGNLGRDPEVNQTKAGKNISKISIACGDDYKDKQGQKVEQSNWINIVFFDRLADVVAEYLKKGSKVYVSGKQVTRKWQDNEGNDRYTTEIIGGAMEMLGGGNGANSGTNQNPAPAKQQSEAPPDFDDDIPF